MAGYGTDGAFEAWLEASGYENSSTLELSALRQRGSVYIDGLYGIRFLGTPAGGYAQERAWPRTGAADYYGSAIPADVVPAPVVEASYFAAYQEAASPGSLSIANSPGSRVKRETVASLEVEYFDDGSASSSPGAAPVFSYIEGLLAPFVNSLREPEIIVV